MNVFRDPASRNTLVTVAAVSAAFGGGLLLPQTLLGAGIFVGAGIVLLVALIWTGRGGRP